MRAEQLKAGVALFNRLPRGRWQAQLRAARREALAAARDFLKNLGVRRQTQDTTLFWEYAGRPFSLDVGRNLLEPTDLLPETPVVCAARVNAVRHADARPWLPPLVVACRPHELVAYAAQAADWACGWRHGENYPHDSPLAYHRPGRDPEYWTEEARLARDAWTWFLGHLDAEDLVTIIREDLKRRPP